MGRKRPQERGQSNMTPQQGADLWKTYLEPLHARGIRLGSPAPSSAPSGLTWLQDFFTACAGACTVDFIALRPLLVAYRLLRTQSDLNILDWYDINATAFQHYLEHFHDTFQKPIWVTEWACQNNNDLNAQCTREDVVRFLNQTQTYMDKTPWVERYAWFGALRDLQGVNQVHDMANVLFVVCLPCRHQLNRLMDQQGRINDLGRQYIGAGNDSVPGVNGSPTWIRLSRLSWLVVLAGNILLAANNM
jgi:hypothetical protein